VRGEWGVLVGELRSRRNTEIYVETLDRSRVCVDNELGLLERGDIRADLIS
jgi:hypothetical protein